MPDISSNNIRNILHATQPLVHLPSCQAPLYRLLLLVDILGQCLQSTCQIPLTPTPSPAHHYPSSPLVQGKDQVLLRSGHTLVRGVGRRPGHLQLTEALFRLLHDRPIRISEQATELVYLIEHFSLLYPLHPIVYFLLTLNKFV